MNNDGRQGAGQWCGGEFVHGGVKVYRGAAGAARTYVEADRSRADDYYLAEGTGIARRYAATGVGPVVALPAMDGDCYEAWVAGADPETGQPRGRLRTDERAVRFVEVVVNGPKSWSLAAELHPDVAAAYEAAQDRAATEIIGWLAQHATTRVGPRGGQIAVPLEQLEAAVVRHYTSRAGDPHRHLHLQVNARVLAAGRWRGIDTVAVRDSIAAINGIGHAAVACDPAFRAALARRGYTLDEGGEITQLARYVGPFSRRAAQIGRHIDRYEAQWWAAHPGAQPGPALRRSWDARAWAEDRPDKVTPRPGADLHRRWLDELARLGYRDSDRPVPMSPPLVGWLNRDQSAAEVLARLGAARSAWNAADIRGEVEQLLARTGIIADPAVRRELAEDLTARTLALCVPLLDRSGIPAHIRALTSAHVVEVEADIVGRLAVRAAEPAVDVDPLAHTCLAVTAAGTGLDAGQIAAVATLAGDRSLVVVEGVAGAGKTTTLAATGDLLTRHGQRLVVVTPTLKAAKAAAVEIGAHTGSAAWLAHQHGWRWTDDGTWTRLAAGDPDPATGRHYAGPGPAARLAAGDLLVVDEAGMLDQDTARALLTVAEEHAARVAFLGDRHQLAAVGRGGVLDLAARWADPHACVSLDVAHRFTRPTHTADGVTVDVPDTGYAALASAMRTGQDAAAVFDALLARGQILVYASDAERQAGVADAAAARTASNPDGVLIVADTVEQVTELNAVIRDRLVAAGAVGDTRVVTTNAGERIGVGDTVATRRNDRDLDVANRDTWTVTATHRDGQLAVTSATVGERLLPAGYVRNHVELAYATTVYGAQGTTSTAAHLIVGEYTGAAAAYVGMTRGRNANTAHLIATDVDEAREQWVATFGRNRADLGPDHARHAAEHAAAPYGSPGTVDDLIAALRQEWDREADDLHVLAWAVPRRDDLRQIAQLHSEHAVETAPLEARHRQALDARALATERAEHSHVVVAAATEHHRGALLAAWNTQRREAHANARTVLDGSGRLGLRWAAVNRAHEALARWAVSWQPIIPATPTGHEAIARFADRADDTPRIHASIDDYARRQAAARHPEHERHVAEATSANRVAVQASATLYDTRARHQRELGHYGSLGHIEDADASLARIADTEQRLDGTRRRIARLEDCLTTAANGGGGQAGCVRVETSPPGQRADVVLAARRHWLDERDAEQHAARLRSAHPVATPESSQELRRQETWRRHEQVLRPASPEPGVGR